MLMLESPLRTRRLDLKRQKTGFAHVGRRIQAGKEKSSLFDLSEVSIAMYALSFWKIL